MSIDGPNKSKGETGDKMVSENNILRTRINKLEKELIYFKSKGDENVNNGGDFTDKDKMLEEFNQERDQMRRKIEEMQKREKNIVQQLLK